MSDKPGSLLGGILLVGGSCVGAGMLALPLLTGLAGFIPSLVMFFAAWAFMTVTGLLMVEVSGCSRGEANIVSMAGAAFGRFGRGLSWILYLFLFYSLLVAYMAGSGSLTHTYFKTFLSLSIPQWVGPAILSVIFGVVVHRGTRRVDHWNRVLMVGKIGAYVVMVVLGMRFVNPELLLRTEPSLTLLSLPVLIISFGYHNMIPPLMSYMKGDVRRVRATILGGSLFALVVYLIWEIVVLGIVPADGEWGLIASYAAGRQVSDAVAGVLGVSWVSTWAEVLALFALLTSLLAQTMALVHFLADGLKVPREKAESPWLCLLALAPPLLFSFIYPNLFIKALNFAGGFCTVILFGLLPAAMVWHGRYIRRVDRTYEVKGGKPLLVGIAFFSLFILFLQLG